MKSFISALACGFFLVLQGCGGGGGGSSDKLAGTWGLTAFPSVESSTCSESGTQSSRDLINSFHPHVVERVSGNDGAVRITFATGIQSLANIVQDNGFTFTEVAQDINLGSVIEYTTTYFFNNSDGSSALGNWTIAINDRIKNQSCRIEISTLLGKTS